MNTENKINTHYSSLLGLKTELLIKQSEVEAVKAKHKIWKSFDKAKIKDKLAAKQKTKNLEENRSNTAEDIESMRILQKSKLMLQAKSRLYEKLSKTHTNMNPNFLVDFIHKPSELDYFEEKYKKVTNDHKSNYDSDSEWVEYTDCFGRTRKCLQEDYPKMQKKDECVRKRMDNNQNSDKKESLLYIENKLIKHKPEIEIMRRKWKEQTTRLTNKVNIHYEDVLFDEARTHGVGYYAFSQNEEERIKQQENLLKLRKETEQQQKQNQEISKIKNKLQENRLRVARLRQKTRTRLLPIREAKEEIIVNNSTLSKLESNVKQDIVINDKIENHCEPENQINDNEHNSKQEIVKHKLVDIENKIENFGQLLGKRNHWYIMSQEEWIYKKRNERIEEFGPINENIESSNLNKFVNSHATCKDLINSYNSSIDHNNLNIGPIIPSKNISVMTPMSSINQSTFIESVPLSSNESNINSSIKNNKVISRSLRGTKFDTNIICQIEVGLKYLREQFENKNA